MEGHQDLFQTSYIYLNLLSNDHKSDSWTLVIKYRGMYASVVALSSGLSAISSGYLMLIQNSSLYLST